MSLSSFRFRGETKELNEATRAEAPGDFVELAHGHTHYELSKSNARLPVILIHGLSIPYYIWDPTFRALSDSGLNVLRYDLFGRGYSDRPRVDYSLDLFVDQLFHLVRELGLGVPFDLVGLSMGGPIAASFCDQHPSLVRKLCLIDPAGVPMKSTVVGKFILRPWIGEYLLSLFGNAILISQLTKDFKEPEKFPAFVEMARAQMKFKGYKRALLSTLRNDALSDLSPIYQRIGKQEMDSLLIWGVEDQLIPFEFHKRICEAIPNIKFQRIFGAGHIPHYEKPEVVNPILIDFFND